MVKRLFDIIASALGLLVMSPILLVILVLVWRQDGHSPFFIGERAAMGGGSFRMVKIRSMIINADRSGVESTSATDNRITPLGHVIRRYKLDEFVQLWNVLKGDMSLVGPRPNTLREVAKYTPYEMTLLSTRPGITDIASIVFSDEGDILKDHADPDAAYERIIRPWKSRLGVLYVENSSIMIDAKLLYITLLAIVNKPKAMHAVSNLVAQLGAPEDLRRAVARLRF